MVKKAEGEDDDDDEDEGEGEGEGRGRVRLMMSVRMMTPGNAPVRVEGEQVGWKR